MHFPPGCCSLVELFIHKKKEQILPEGKTGIALDNATYIFQIDKPVTQGDPIQVTAVNHDDTYSHTVTAIIYVEEKTPISVETAKMPIYIEKRGGIV